MKKILGFLKVKYLHITERNKKLSRGQKTILYKIYCICLTVGCGILVDCMRHEEEKGCSGREVLPPCLKGGA